MRYDQAVDIYVINLVRRPDRATLISSGLDALGLKFSFVEAVDWQAEGTYPKQQLLKQGYACNVLSHHKAMELFLSSDAKYAIIMEDDAVLRPDVDWPVFLEWLETELVRKELDYLQLGFISHFYSVRNFAGFLRDALGNLGTRSKRTIQLGYDDMPFKIVLGESRAGCHFYVCSRRFAEITPPLNQPQWVSHDGFLERLASATAVLKMARMRVSLAEQDSRQTKAKRVDSDVLGSPRG
jgi:hypothetical protein